MLDEFTWMYKAIAMNGKLIYRETQGHSKTCTSGVAGGFHLKKFQP